MAVGGMEPQQLVKLSAGVIISIAAVRFLWKRYCTNDSAPAAQARSIPGMSTPKHLSPKASQKSQGETDLYIYFGSQSGTAEGFAKELESEAQQHELTSTVVDLEDFDPDEFVKQKVVIFVVATYGEGDPTDNSVEFFKWLQGDEREPDECKGVQFCVMGLGNRQYVNFNSCGKVCDSRIEKLGGARIYERGEGDDDQNIEEDFEQWKEHGLWAALRKAAGKEQEGAAEGGPRKAGKKEILASLVVRAEIREDARKLPVDPLVQTGGACTLGKWYFQAHQAPVVTEYELRQQVDAAAGKTTKHLDFDVKSIPTLDWRTADNLEVLPSNPSDVIDWWADRLKVKDQLDSFVGFVRVDGVERPVKKPFPTPCTVRDALSLYCDLCMAPTKGQLKRFAPFLSDDKEREVVESILEDRSVYQWLTGEKNRVTFAELFELFFSSLEMDFSTFLQLCPRQKSRPYTIASSSKEDKTKIGVCVSVVAEELQTLEAIVRELGSKGHSAPCAVAALSARAQAARSFRGLCSTMLCTRITKGQRLWIAARPSSFRLPRKSTAPIVMVGAGTGIAPFRAFVREFRAENSTRQKTVLYFGCQKRDVDYLYKEELEEALQSQPKILGELVNAFSREQDEKVYVQHRVKERAHEIMQLIQEGAYVYVCGATSMGAAIRDELSAALGSPDHVARLQTEGRYVEELW